MEEIEQQITQLKTEIKTVQNQIENVEFYLKKPYNLWTEEEKETYGTKDQLRRKEEQLRNEKEQLRNEKEQLRRKEEQLLEQKTILMKKDAEGMIMKES